MDLLVSAATAFIGALIIFIAITVAIVLGKKLKNTKN